MVVLEDKALGKLKKKKISRYMEEKRMATRDWRACTKFAHHVINSVQVLHFQTYVGVFNLFIN